MMLDYEGRTVHALPGTDPAQIQRFLDAEEAYYENQFRFLYGQCRIYRAEVKLHLEWLGRIGGRYNPLNLLIWWMTGR